MQTKKFFGAMLLVSGMTLGFVGCSDDDKEVASSLALDKATVTGDVGSSFTVNVAFTGSKITTLKVAKFLDGTKDAGYTFADVAVSGASYTFNGTISLTDGAAGAVSYTFAGYDAAGAEVDAADLVVTVNLTGVALLLRYDWKRTSRLCTWALLGWEDEEDIKDAEKEYVYRFNADNSWQFDWGTTKPSLPSIYCAWKIISSATTPVDSLILVRYVDDVRDDQRAKIVKLDNSELWISIYTESWDLTELIKHTAVSKSADFTPYRGDDPNDYVSANCNPGSY